MNPTGASDKRRNKKTKAMKKAMQKQVPNKKGRSSAASSPPRRRGVAPGARFSFTELSRTLPLHNALKAIARKVTMRQEALWEAKYEKKGAVSSSSPPPPPPPLPITSAQVALNWVAAQGAVPLAGVTNADDAKEVAGCIGWRLQPGDLEVLEEAVEEGKATKVTTSASPTS
jgi:aryl-alcohol dehydrogenase-like predicted oxidoreductase